MTLKMKSILFSASVILLVTFVVADDENTTIIAEDKGITEYVTPTAPQIFENVTLAAKIEEIVEDVGRNAQEIVDNITTTVKIIGKNGNTTLKKVAENIDSIIQAPIESINSTIDPAIRNISTVIESINILDILKPTAKPVKSIVIGNINLSFTTPGIEDIDEVVKYRVKNWYEKYPIYFTVEYKYAGKESEAQSEIIPKGGVEILDIPAAALDSFIRVWYTRGGIKYAAYGNFKKVQQPRADNCFEVCNVDVPVIGVPKVAFCSEKACAVNESQ